MGWVVNATPRPLYLRGRPGTHCKGGWVGLRAGWTSAGHIASTGIRSPERPARSESKSRLLWIKRCGTKLSHLRDNGTSGLLCANGAATSDSSGIAKSVPNSLPTGRPGYWNMIPSSYKIFVTYSEPYIVIHMCTRPTRRSLFLKNLFQLHYPRHVSNK
jgi:hypothetical protein